MTRLFPTKTSILKLTDATVGHLLCRAAGTMRHWMRLPHSGPSVNIHDMKRILVIRPGGLGDMIMLLPTLAAIRDGNPSAKIEVVCERRNASILRLAGMDVPTHLYDVAPVRLLRALWRGGFDAVVDTEQFHHFSSLFAIAAGAPVRVGFSCNPVRLSLYTHLVPYDPSGYEAREFARLLAPLGLQDVNWSIRGILSEADLAVPDELTAELMRVSGGGAYAAICPGSHNKYKSWKPSKYVDVILGLRARGLAVVLVGGKEDITQCQKIVAMAETKGCRVASFAGKLPLAQSAAVIRGAVLVVGCDSALSHLAAALDKPSVTLFGPSNPSKWAHADAEHAVLRGAISCSPCSMFGYTKLCHGVTCMSLIEARDVLDACDRVAGHRSKAAEGQIVETEPE